ncbi:NACHT domain-containing protein [Kitasatospora sp. NPDC048239]|uniref:NACHT domain-containing protein n=1 Tax=Kitasatospora sp. NPDC048239 TaxID=3364046 RepID=UPI00371F22F8
MASELSNYLYPALWVSLAAIGLGIFLKAALTEFGKTVGAKIPAASARMVSRVRPMGGRKLRRYRRLVLDKYSKHRLGFSEGSEGQPINIREVYVPLRGSSAGRQGDAYELISLQRRSVLLGEPGAGKSLLLKNAMVHWAQEENDEQIPVMVDLHRCNQETDKSFEQLIVGDFETARVRHAGDLVDQRLLKGRIRVFFDGLDEVGDAEQGRVVRTLQDFSAKYSDCQIIVTCRNAAYRDQLDESFDQVVRLAEFDDASVIRFLRKWPDIGAPVDAARIFKSLQSDPELMGLARSPLMLTMIAYLQSGDRPDNVGPLPNSRAAFYETAVFHLLDRDRRLGREAPGQYTAQRKFMVLQVTARTWMETAARDGDWQAIPREELEDVIRGLLPGFDLTPEHARPLLDKIVRRSELIKPLDQAGRFYTFSHLTLMDYFAASALFKSPDRLMANYRSAPDVWRETVRMWCAVTIMDCTPVVREVFTGPELREKVLALQCLGDATHVTEGLAEEILAYFFDRLGGADGDGSAVAEGLGALAASSRQRGSRVRDRLIRTVAEASAPQRLAILAALAASGRQEAAEAMAQCAQNPADIEARDALQSMGEIAVPVLAEAAHGGAVWAVHSLGVVGTPAAAEQLAGLLWSDHGSTARHAAWLLASLLTCPDVEEDLRQLASPTRASSTETYPAIWYPFTNGEPANSPLPTVAARIGYQLDAGHITHPDLPDWGFTEIPDCIRQLDFRIGIPVAAIGIATGWPRGSLEFDEWDNLNELTRQAADQILPRHQRYATAAALPSLSRPIYAPELLHTEQAALPESADALAPLRDGLLTVLMVPQVYRRIIELLPWPVQAHLLAALTIRGHADLWQPPDRPVNWDTWKAVRDNPPAPRLLEHLTRGFSLVVLAGAVGLGGARLVASALDSHPWGLDVLRPWALGLSAAAFALLLAILLIVAVIPSSWGKVEDRLAGIFAGLFFGLGGFLLTIAVMTLIQLIGWLPMVALGFVLACGIFVPAVIARRRHRARSNPLRGCLEAGEMLRASGLRS